MMKLNLNSVWIQACLVTAAIAGFAPSALAQMGLGQMMPAPPMAAPKGIMVLGQGHATAPADLAVLEFMFSPKAIDSEEEAGPLKKSARVSDYPIAAEPESDPAIDLPKLTEADLQPVIAGLLKLGIARSMIEFPTAETPLGKSAKLLRIKLTRPTPERVQQIIKTVEEISLKNDKFDHLDHNIAYEIKDCRPVERAALKEAVKNAQQQAQDLADTLGVNLGEMTMAMGRPSFDMTASCGNNLLNMGLAGKLLRAMSGSDSGSEVRATSSLYIMYEMRKK